MLNVAKEQATRLLNQVGSYLLSLARDAESEESLNRALAIIERLEHPRVIHQLNNLALFFQDLGKLEQARKLLKDALTVFHRFYGDDHPITTKARTNLERLIEKMNGE